MWRWTKRFVGAALGLLALAAVSGASYQWIAERRDLARTPPPGQMVDVGGYRVHLWCAGSGTPPVVYDPGVGGDAFALHGARSAIASFTTVCTYDRAGMGYSDPGPMPRTSRRIASEAMPRLIESPQIVNAVGNKPKRIEEFAGRVASGHDAT